jgi:adenosylcobinamide-phosphate synthase
MTALLALLSLLIELAFGYPKRLFDAIGHPVTWIGALIGWLDRTLNRDNDTPASEG